MPQINCLPPPPPCHLSSERKYIHREIKLLEYTIPSPHAVFLKFGQLYLPRPAEGIPYSNIFVDINLCLHLTTNETKHTLNITILHSLQCKGHWRKYFSRAAFESKILKRYI